MISLISRSADLEWSASFQRRQSARTKIFVGLTLAKRKDRLLAHRATVLIGLISIFTFLIVCAKRNCAAGETLTSSSEPRLASARVLRSCMVLRVCIE